MQRVDTIPIAKYGKEPRILQLACLMTRPIGLLNVNKPAGMTSRQVVDRVLHIVKPAKCGHAGTLDPLATGVLIVCVGRATRLIAYVQQQPKTYRAEFLLGRTSDTDDTDGEVVTQDETPPITRVQIEDALPLFVGEIEQTPPQFSAIKVQGRRAYALARKGKSVDLKPRPVTVHRIDFIAFDSPKLTLEIECGSGTYIRSIGRDLGQQLGCGAVMSALERTRIGAFTSQDALSLEALTDGRSLTTPLHPLIDAVPSLPRHTCTPGEAADVCQGRRLTGISDIDRLPTDAEEAALVDETGHLLAIAEIDRRHASLRPRIVLPG